MVQRMFILKRLAQGFVVVVLALGISNVAVLLANDHIWLGLLYLSVLAIPLFTSAYLLLRSRKSNVQKIVGTERIAGLLFALQGVALACWSFDNATTFYAIDVARIATELNPLGWPLGALGALVYYMPTLILTYVLLFQIKQKPALYVAICVIAISLYMGCMNLNAGINNFKVFLTFAPSSISKQLQSSLFTMMATIDLIYAITFVTIVRKQPFNHQRGSNIIKKN